MAGWSVQAGSSLGDQQQAVSYSALDWPAGDKLCDQAGSSLGDQH